MHERHSRKERAEDRDHGPCLGPREYNKRKCVASMRLNCKVPRRLQTRQARTEQKSRRLSCSCFALVRCTTSARGRVVLDPNAHGIFQCHGQFNPAPLAVPSLSSWPEKNGHSCLASVPHYSEHCLPHTILFVINFCIRPPRCNLRSTRTSDSRLEMRGESNPCAAPPPRER